MHHFLILLSLLLYLHSITALAFNPKSSFFKSASGKATFKYGLGGAARSTQPKILPSLYSDLVHKSVESDDADVAPFYFYYNPHRYPDFMSGIKEICEDGREDVFIASGGTDRSYSMMERRLQDALAYCGGEYLDMFVLEYVCHGEENDIKQALKQAIEWKRRGLVRYIAASTHSHEIGASLCSETGIDALMLRYNMSHRKAAENISFPACKDKNIPVIAFTTTRWNALQSGHEHSQNDTPPTSGECLSYALMTSPPVDMVLHSARDEEELKESMDALRCMSKDVIFKWGKYGDLNWNEMDGFDEYPHEQTLTL